MKNRELNRYLEQVLQSNHFKDYCPNGLQVEGRSEISTIVTGVTASVALIDAAIELGADALLVHHGYFWNGENACIIGQKYQRLKRLLAHEINLFAFHLPLDAHAEFGNNVQFGRVLGLQESVHFGEQNLGSLGRWQGTLATLAAQVEKCLQRQPLVLGDATQTIRRVAWCTGAAQNYFQAAIDAGAQVFISGEISESTTHLARETGVAYIAAGHHATERYGVAALGEHLNQRYGVVHHFVDIANPV